jgi:transcriptional regulator with XRE-family HTH domain
MVGEGCAIEHTGAQAEGSMGHRLRQMRRQRGLTLRDLGQRTGFSVSFLSQVERGTSSLTLSSLARIADALEVPVERVFAAPPLETVVTRRQDRRPFRLEFSPVVYTRLGMNGTGAHMDSLLIELPAHCAPSPEAFRHPGQEFAFVLSGELAMHLEGEEYRLGEGDAIQFSAQQLHNWSNPGDEVVRAVWVTTERLFGSHP